MQTAVKHYVAAVLQLPNQQEVYCGIGQKF
jgi:hypothetical protein